MDEHPNAAPRAANDPLRAEHDLQRYLNDPNAAQSYRHDVEKQHPRLPEITEARAFTKRLRDREQREIDRRYEAKAVTDLTRQCAGAVHTPARGFDQLIFLGFWAISIIFGLQGVHALATYVSSSGIIPALDGNYLKATLFSSLPLGGGFLFKALGDLQPDDKARSRYYLRLGFFGSCAFVFWVLLMSGTFAPNPIDTAALAEQLESGHVLNTKSAFSDYAPILVLGSGLIAEALISAVVLAAATKLNHARRAMVVTSNEIQMAHDNAIADRIDRIAKYNLTLANLDAEEAGIRAKLDANADEFGNVLQMFNAQQRKNLRRVIDEFHGKKGGK